MKDKSTNRPTSPTYEAYTLPITSLMRFIKDWEATTKNFFWKSTTRI